MRKSLFASLLACLILAACGGAERSNGTFVAPSDKLNILNWSDYVDPDTIVAFAKSHHTSIRYDYHGSSESLEAKILTEKSGYDLVAPSIVNVGRQIKTRAYREIDKQQIPNYRNINSDLLAMMNKVDPDNKYAVPYFWGINTLVINKNMVVKALGLDKLPENEWDLVFNPEYTRKLRSYGISYSDSVIEQIPLVLNYLGKGSNSEGTEDIRAAVTLMKKVRPDVKCFTSSGYIDDMAAGSLCVAIGYGGDLNIAKNCAAEAKNGVDIQVLVPLNGVGIWVDSFMIPHDAGNVGNVLAYINYTLEPEVAAKNGSYVTYVPTGQPARKLMDAKYADGVSIFPDKEIMEKSFIVSPKSSVVSKLSVRLWQGLKAGR